MYSKHALDNKAKRMPVVHLHRIMIPKPIQKTGPAELKQDSSDMNKDCFALPTEESHSPLSGSSQKSVNRSESCTLHVNKGLSKSTDSTFCECPNYRPTLSDFESHNSKVNLLTVQQ